MSDGPQVVTSTGGAVDSRSDASAHVRLMGTLHPEAQACIRAFGLEFELEDDAPDDLAADASPGNATSDGKDEHGQLTDGSYEDTEESSDDEAPSASDAAQHAANATSEEETPEERLATQLKSSDRSRGQLLRQNDNLDVNIGQLQQANMKLQADLNEALAQVREYRRVAERATATGARVLARCTRELRQHGLFPDDVNTDSDCEPPLDDGPVQSVVTLQRKTTRAESADGPQTQAARAPRRAGRPPKRRAGGRPAIKTSAVPPELEGAFKFHRPEGAKRHRMNLVEEVVTWALAQRANYNELQIEKITGRPRTTIVAKLKKLKEADLDVLIGRIPSEEADA